MTGLPGGKGRGYIILARSHNWNNQVVWWETCLSKARVKGPESAAPNFVSSQFETPSTNVSHWLFTSQCLWFWFTQRGSCRVKNTSMQHRCTSFPTNPRYIWFFGSFDTHCVDYRKHHWILNSLRVDVTLTSILCQMPRKAWSKNVFLRSIWDYVVQVWWWLSGLHRM